MWWPTGQYWAQTVIIGNNFRYYLTWGVCSKYKGGSAKISFHPFILVKKTHIYDIINYVLTFKLLFVKSYYKCSVVKKWRKLHFGTDFEAKIVISILKLYTLYYISIISIQGRLSEIKYLYI